MTYRPHFWNKTFCEVSSTSLTMNNWTFICIFIAFHAPVKAKKNLLLHTCARRLVLIRLEELKLSVASLSSSSVYTRYAGTSSVFTLAACDACPVKMEAKLECEIKTLKILVLLSLIYLSVRHCSLFFFSFFGWLTLKPFTFSKSTVDCGVKNKDPTMFQKLRV